MRAGVLLMVLALAGCGRDWSLPEAPRSPPDAACGPERPCTFGVCTENGWCDETECTTDSSCRYGRCDERGRCDESVCESDADCRYGLCDERGRCDATLCASDADCSYGLCVGDTCDMLACRSDADCPPGSDLVCNGGGADVSRCVASTNLGPMLLGDPRALTMRDNLDAAFAFVRERHPQAELVQITGLGLSADGAVDVGNGYESMWMYGFRDGDGVDAPPTYVTVTYSLLGGDAAGYYQPDAGNVTRDFAFPDEVRTALLDSDRLAERFFADAACAPFAQDSGDSLVYLQQETGPYFVMSNWRSQSFYGDPVTGEATASCD